MEEDDFVNDFIKRNILKVFSIVSFICIIIVFNFYYGITYVEGTSMQSELENGEILLVKKSYEEKDIERGDIAILDIDYHGEKTRIVKRIIGVAGDQIKIEGNKLYINNKEYAEDYLYEKMNTTNMSCVVPEDNIFIMGDNRNKSMDSRYEEIGFINFDQAIYGEIVYSISKVKKIE